VSFSTTAPGDAYAGGAAYAPAASATSGLTVTLSIDAASIAICSLSGGQVTFLAGGSCVVNADQAGDATYGPATSSQTFTVQGEPPASQPDQTPPSWLQSLGRATESSCPDGWSASWAEWAVASTGGWVCNRTVFWMDGGWYVQSGDGSGPRGHASAWTDSDAR